MSDMEQAQLAMGLAATSAPLTDAAAQRQACEHQEWQAQLRYQDVKRRIREVQAKITQLQRAERLAPRKEDVHLWRAERRALTEDLVTLAAAVGVAEAERQRCNGLMVTAQRAHRSLCEQASTHYRVMKVGLSEAHHVERTAAQQQDALERSERAYVDLCALIGQEEADRLRDSSEKPQWFRS